MDPGLIDTVKNAVEEALKRRGKVNIILAGKTGVGKSTLINAVFQGNLAETGQGRPVTQNTREITKEGIPVSLFDTRGLELAEYKQTVNSLQKFIEERKQETEAHRHMHVAWVCISEDSRRVEEGEIQLVEMLSAHIPTVVVITKAKADKGFRAEVQKILPKARNVISVHAVEEIFDDGHKISVKGLKELVELTMELVPESQKNAFAAAQKVSLEQKVNRAHTVVAASATVAGAAAATPIPFSDAILIVPVQVGMLAGISAAFGLPVSQVFISTLVASTFTGVAATVAGRAIVSSLLKLIPGVGSLVGGTIAAGTSIALTTAFGEAYIGTLYLLLKDDPSKSPTAEQIAYAFKQKLAGN
ncbi:50S ribosome-binding GTPase [Myxococcota bacterium]|nr:50S ribosome-binding GTPase [Myxococcota bacterium]